MRGKVEKRNFQGINTNGITLRTEISGGRVMTYQLDPDSNATSLRCNQKRPGARFSRR